MIRPKGIKFWSLDSSKCICCAANWKEQKGNIMEKKTILLLMVGVLGAYYLYTPLPDNIEEPWRVTCQMIPVKIIIDLVSIKFN